jgi:uncharacterized protein YuzE
MGRGEMKYKYDKSADCAYIQINDLPHAYTKEMDNTRIVDYAADGMVIGIELLYISDGVDTSNLPFESDLVKILTKHHVKVQKFLAGTE